MIGNSTVISEVDFDRLSHLMESPRVRTSYASLLGGLKHELASGRWFRRATSPGASSR